MNQRSSSGKNKNVADYGEKTWNCEEIVEKWDVAFNFLMNYKGFIRNELVNILYLK